MLDKLMQKIARLRAGHFLDKEDPAKRKKICMYRDLNGKEVHDFMQDQLIEAIEAYQDAVNNIDLHWNLGYVAAMNDVLDQMQDLMTKPYPRNDGDLDIPEFIRVKKTESTNHGDGDTAA